MYTNYLHYLTTIIIHSVPTTCNYRWEPARRYTHIIGSETTHSLLRGTGDTQVGSSEKVSVKAYVLYPLTITSWEAVGNLSASTSGTIEKDGSWCQVNSFWRLSLMKLNCGTRLNLTFAQSLEYVPATLKSTSGRPDDELCPNKW